MALTLTLQTTRWLREQDADGDGRLSYKVNTVKYRNCINVMIVE